MAPPSLSNLLPLFPLQILQLSALPLSLPQLHLNFGCCDPVHILPPSCVFKELSHFVFLRRSCGFSCFVDAS